MSIGETKERAGGRVYSQLHRNPFFKDVIIDTEQFKGKKKNCCTRCFTICKDLPYLRYVNPIDKKIKHNLIPVDQIELDCIKAAHSPLSDITIQCEIRVLISVGVMYAGLNPAVCLLAFGLLFFDNLIDNFMKTKVY